MKSLAILAFTASTVFAGSIELPTIEWDDSKFSQEEQRWTQWSETHEYKIQQD
jgi:hypothetical protein